MRWMQAGLAVVVAFFGVSRGALTDFVGQLPPCGVSNFRNASLWWLLLEEY